MLKQTLRKEVEILKKHQQVLANSIAEVEGVLEEDKEEMYPASVFFVRLFLLGFVNAQECSMDTENPDLTINELWVKYAQDLTKTEGGMSESKLILPN